MSVLSETYEPELEHVRYVDEVEIIPACGHLLYIPAAEFSHIKNYSYIKGFSKFPDILEKVTRENFGRFMSVISFYPSELGFYIMTGFKNGYNITYKLKSKYDNQFRTSAYNAG